MSEITTEKRVLQTRYFDTRDELQLLQASAQILQDLGYVIEKSEVPLGLVVGAKDRSAVEGGQVVAAIAVALLTGSNQAIDKQQRIRVSLVTRSVSPERTSLRATFQRTVWRTDGQISRNEMLDDPEMYREFFEQVSKSVFLEAHGI